MDLTVKTPAATFSIDKDLVKSGKRIRHASEGTLVDFWIAVADQYVEKRTNRALMAQTFVLRLRRILPTVFLPRPPLTSITSVKYTTEDGSEAAITEADYIKTIDRMLTRLDIPSISASGESGTMEIEYIAGSPDPDDVPAPLRQASYLLTAHYLTSREAAFMDVRTMNVEKRIVFGVDELVKEFRVPNGTALNDGW